MATVKISNLQKKYGATTAVADLSLTVEQGELVSFLGPSGCGKTTTLRMVAGFITPTSGSIRIGDKEVSGLLPEKRDTGMVFQRYALFPHLTVAQNVSFGLEMRKIDKAERQKRIGESLEMVRMSAMADRYPRQLSGGQQQRVAIARALAIRPKVFLLDEPLSNLDAKLRIEVREEIRSLQKRLGLTTIFVTHDQEEALTISDRLAIMHNGVIQQTGTPDELYEQPANRFVADFLGRMNFFEGRFNQGDFLTNAGTRLNVSAGEKSITSVGIRPERIKLRHLADGFQNAVPATVEATVYMGSTIEVRARTQRGDMFVVHEQNIARSPNDAVGPGQSVHICFDTDDCVAFQ